MSPGIRVARTFAGQKTGEHVGAHFSLPFIIGMSWSFSIFEEQGDTEHQLWEFKYSIDGTEIVFPFNGGAYRGADESEHAYTLFSLNDGTQLKISGPNTLELMKLEATYYGANNNVGEPRYVPYIKMTIPKQSYVQLRNYVRRVSNASADVNGLVAGHYNYKKLLSNQAKVFAKHLAEDQLVGNLGPEIGRYLGGRKHKTRRVGRGGRNK